MSTDSPYLKSTLTFVTSTKPSSTKTFNGQTMDTDAQPFANTSHHETGMNFPFYFRVEDHEFNAQYLMFLIVSRQPHHEHTTCVGERDCEKSRQKISISSVFNAMCAQGGYYEVVKNKRMGAVRFSLGLMNHRSSWLKDIYQQSVLSFENFKLRGLSILGPCGVRYTSHQSWVFEGTENTQLDSCFTDAVPIDVVNQAMATAMASPLYNKTGLLMREFQQAAIIARKRVEQLCGVVASPVLTSVVASPVLTSVVASPVLTSVVAYPYRQPRVACWLAPTKASGSPISYSSGVNQKRKQPDENAIPPQPDVKRRPNA